MKFVFLEKKHKEGWKKLSQCEGVVYFLELPAEFVLIRYSTPELEALERLSLELGPLEFSRKVMGDAVFRDHVKKVSDKEFEITYPDWKKGTGFRGYSTIGFGINGDTYLLEAPRKSNLDIASNEKKIELGQVSIGISIPEKAVATAPEVKKVFGQWEEWARSHGVVTGECKLAVTSGGMDIKVWMGKGFENFLASLIVMLFDISKKWKSAKLVYS